MFIVPREIMRRIDAGGARESGPSYCLVTALRKLPIYPPRVLRHARRVRVREPGATAGLNYGR